jgi:hypothetical protein
MVYKCSAVFAALFSTVAFKAQHKLTGITYLFERGAFKIFLFKKFVSKIERTQKNSEPAEKLRWKQKVLWSGSTFLKFT